MAQAFATALLNEWGGGVQKDAGLKDTIFKKTIGKGVESVMRRVIGNEASALAGSAAPAAAKAVVGTGAKKLLGNVAANQSSGVAGTGASGVARGALRSLANVKPGTKTFQKPLDYITKPLRAAIAPNLGKTLNTTRLGLMAGFTGHQGYKGYEATGTASTRMQLAAETARMLGASNDVINDINRYTTRSGVVRGWLRGHGVSGKLVGQTSDTGRQRAIDRIVATGGNELALGGLANSYKSSFKPHEYLNPIGGAVSRGLMTAAGKAGIKYDSRSWSERVDDELRGLWGNEGGKEVAHGDTGSLGRLAQGIRSRIGSNMAQLTAL